MQLDAIAEEIEPNGTVDEDDDQPVDEDRIRRLHKLFATFANMEFPPREDAWRCQDDDGRRISASSVARVPSTPRSLRP